MRRDIIKGIIVIAIIINCISCNVSMVAGDVEMTRVTFVFAMALLAVYLIIDALRDKDFFNNNKK